MRWEQPVEAPWSFAPLAADLAARLRTHRDALAAAIEEIDYANREVTVHAARIAAKRVRYLLDPVKQGVPEARPALKLLKSFQDDFGELHDLHVARNELDSGVIERAAHEANERTREILDAAGEGRPPRRFASKLGGFSSVAAAVREEEHARFKAIEVRWLHDSAAIAARGDRRRDSDACTSRRRRHSEIEHKYLLAAEPTIPDECVTDVIEIEQGYLPGERITERLRRECHADGTIRLVRTLKTGHGLVRTEIEEDVSADVFDALWPMTAERRVRKRRTKASTGTRTCFEIDVFLDRTLVLAEVEVEQIDDPVDLPPWLARRAGRRGHRRLVLLQRQARTRPNCSSRSLRPGGMFAEYPPSGDPCGRLRTRAVRYRASTPCVAGGSCPRVASRSAALACS